MKYNIRPIGYRALAIMLFAVSFAACKNRKLQDTAPKCFLNLVEQFKHRSVQNPPAEVWEWKLDNSIYYFVNAPCCDQFNTLYNKECQKVCAPSGGFTGKGDGNCPSGLAEKAEKKLLWKDGRTSTGQ